ncbi:protein trapped in endoderm-1-like [Mizuhopecten yessoensis]|uniref:protein trapped in endoderm-1-like n=1 Tax=Mizuhopecten yessoensis TaxID=6573 RepID=UPI000B45E481|nr:protein trapped in endoderm-1-like [Mizuhopecten yessoensis]XP_021368226.1 protein trapped in endoderm-1-like [Mizuhopecten yessoensis]
MELLITASPESLNDTYRALPVPDDIRFYHNIAATIMAVIGFPANLAITVAIFKTKLHKHVGTVFILNLVINNMVVCITCLPYISILSFTVPDSTTSGLNLAFCKFMGYIAYSIKGSELLGLVLISMNRYLIVVHFSKYQQIYNSRINIIKMLVVSWSIYPLVLLFPVTELWGILEYDPNRFFCQPFFANNSFKRFLLPFALITSIPVILYCYVGILIRFWISKETIYALRSKSRTSSSTAVHGKYTRRDMRLVVMVMLILTTFFFLYMPFVVMSVLDPQMKIYSPLLHLTFIYMSWARCLVNPLVYSIMNPRIRNACLVSYKHDSSS